MRLEAIREHTQANKFGLALRLDSSDLSDLRSGSRLKELLASLSFVSDETVLILDLGSPAMLDPSTFSNFVSDLVVAAQRIGPWQRVVVEATNYPDFNPASPNGTHEVKRIEWLAWKELVKSHPWIAKIASYGDYGADNAKFRFKSSGGRVQTHLRYTLPNAWMIYRGGEASETSDGTIHWVAQQVRKSPHFAGELFSDGDEEIARWAARVGGPGGATEWRRANMNHHMTRVTVDLGDITGNPVARRAARRQPQQQDMFGTL